MFFISLNIILIIYLLIQYAVVLQLFVFDAENCVVHGLYSAQFWLYHP